MQLDDRGHEIKAETHAWCISYLVGTVKTPLHGIALLGADATAGVRHAHDGRAFAAQQFDSKTEEAVKKDV